MRIVFMGTPPAAVLSLERLLSEGHDVIAVYTQPDRPVGRGQKVASSAVKQFAVDKGLRVLQPPKIRTEEALTTFRSHGADAAVVVAYGRILPEQFLTAYPHGAINVHFSLLPKYRGAAPVNWAIVNGEVDTGVTTMQMDAGLDTGPILLQKATPILPEENAPELMARLAALGADLLIESLHKMDTLVPRPQENELATFAPILRKEDGLIDWSRSAKEIADRVRGFQPFPGSYTFDHRNRLTIWRASAVSAETSNHTFGEVIAAGGDDLRVACGQNSALQINEIQPEGKRRMPVRDFMNGTRLSIGTIFGYKA